MTTPASTSTADFARAYFEAINQHDLDRAAEHWNPDVVEDFVAIGEFRGPAAGRAFLAELFAAAREVGA